jgi:hypothetical protein
MIRFDDFPTGIRPITKENNACIKKILDCFQKENLPVYLGIVPELLNEEHNFLKEYTNIILF